MGLELVAFRLGLVGLALLLSAGIGSAEPIYFLVDNSGSMVSHRPEIDTLVSNSVRSLPIGDEFAIQYFSGASQDDCEGAVEIPAVRPAEGNILIDAPAAGGSTLIGRALETVFLEIGGAEAKINLYTDGRFEDSKCETASTVCAVADRLLITHPKAEIEFHYPVGGEANELSALNCADPEISIEPLTSLVEPQAPSEDGGGGAGFGLSGVGTTAAISFLPLLVLGLLIVNIISIRRFTSQIEQSEESQDLTKKTTSFERGAYITISILIGLLLLVIAINYRQASAAFNIVYQEANRPFLSILIPYALTGVLGWYVIERLKDSSARERKDWRVKHAEALSQADRIEIQSIVDKLSQKQTIRKDRELLLLRSARLSIADEDTGRLDDLASKIDEVYESLAQAISRVQNIAAFRAIKYTFLYDYEVAVVKLLMAAEEINSEQAADTKIVFSSWFRFIDGLPKFDPELESKINSFDVSALRFRD